MGLNLWEITWKLIDEYGYDEDIVNGNGGNNLAMKLVMEALKITPYSPSIESGFDALLAIDENMFDGAFDV